jgi:hypothetical protein
VTRTRRLDVDWFTIDQSMGEPIKRTNFQITLLQQLTRKLFMLKHLRFYLSFALVIVLVLRHLEETDFAMSERGEMLPVSKFNFIQSNIFEQHEILKVCLACLLHSSSEIISRLISIRSLVRNIVQSPQRMALTWLLSQCIKCCCSSGK